MRIQIALSVPRLTFKNQFAFIINNAYHPNIYSLPFISIENIRQNKTILRYNKSFLLTTNCRKDLVS